MEDLGTDAFKGWSDAFVDVYRNGELLKEFTLEEVRATIQGELERLESVEWKTFLKLLKTILFRITFYFFFQILLNKMVIGFS